ncbi:MAG: 37kDa nucleoid-associated protein [Firmicutes bacterium]|nr:37kDa nucleoid-associated protein [Bacillota bacterium]
MFDFSNIRLEKLVIHKVGNKLHEEGMGLSQELYPLEDGNVEELLLKYFLSPFKEKVLYKLHHQTDIHLNEVYSYVSAAFIRPDTFYEQSVNMAKHLYEQATHPKIRGGEFYMAYFSGCTIQDQMVDAIGMFKTERKENYLKIIERQKGVVVGMDTGINIKKLDKGCIIFNSESMNGYRVAVVDSASDNEAVYWKDEFLRVTHVEDEYFYTQNQLNLCRDFAQSVYGPLYQADKKDQVMFINEAVAYFDSNQSYNVEDFTKSVLKEPELIEEFKTYKECYETNQGLASISEFDISGHAVKSVKRKLKNLIKLDTDIEIKLKVAGGEGGQQEFIERGYDEKKGMHFYKVFFNHEE